MVRKLNAFLTKISKMTRISILTTSILYCPRDFICFSNLFTYLFVLERETDRHRFVVPLIYAFIGWFLYVPWQDLVWTHYTLVYQDDALTNWATCAGPCTRDFRQGNKIRKRNYRHPVNQEEVKLSIFTYDMVDYILNANNSRNSH